MKAHKKEMSFDEFKKQCFKRFIMLYDKHEITFRPAMKGVIVALPHKFQVARAYHKKTNNTWFWIKNRGCFHLEMLDNNKDVGTCFVYEDNVSVDELMKSKIFESWLTEQYHQYRAMLNDEVAV